MNTINGADSIQFLNAHSITLAKIYEAKRVDKIRPVVFVDGNLLNPRFDIWPFNFDGFEWGHDGSGSIQLALAILADHLSDTKRAFKLCEQFSRNIIAELPSQGWMLTSKDIQVALDKLNI
jgi:hypothetical protein